MAEKKKKTFKPGLDSVVNQFFSNQSQVENTAEKEVGADLVQRKATAEKIADVEKKEVVEYKRNPDLIEKKTRRVQLLMQPSLFEALKDAAEEKGISVNELIHQTLGNIFVDK